MENKWYQKSYRRNLVDMHISDMEPIYMSEYDPVDYVNNLITAGVDTAILYAGNCLGICFWPTKAGHMHKNLKGRDILKEVIAECRNKGLHVVIYFNIWSRWAYDTHPEWRYLDGDGKGIYVDSVSPDAPGNHRFGVCCPNTLYSDYVYDQINDLTKNYDMDGLWIDMIGFFNSICFCDSCKKRYYKETGKNFPDRIDWRDEAWRSFQKHREKWYAEFFANIRKTANFNKPDISVVFNSAAWSLGWTMAASKELYEKTSYLAGDFYGEPVEQSFVCKYFNKLTQNKPIEFMSSVTVNLEEHTLLKEKDNLQAQAFSAIANNAAYVFIDAMDPIGTTNPKTYKMMRDILSNISIYEKYLNPELELCNDVAIYIDIDSLASMSDNGKDIKENPGMGNACQNLLNIAKTLINNNIAYDVATYKDLDNLNKYKVLILPDAFMLNEAASESIKMFVYNGGILYASKDSSYIYGNGNFLLTELFGVSRQGVGDERITYISPINEYLSFEPFDSKYPLAVNERSTIVKVDNKNAKVLATITYPYTPVNDTYKYASAISNPPGRKTDLPALVQNQYGKGIVLYSVCCLESAINTNQQIIFAKLIKSFIKRPKYKTDAPKVVEITLYNDKINNSYILCLLNFQNPLPNIPIFNINMGVDLTGINFIELKHLPDEVSVKCDKKDNYLNFIVDKLDTFTMYKINYKNKDIIES
ncbi:MAG: hypothetical protein K0S55_1787 [Clostridia bacterium]|nr:hypothetical protein [Clostridia bacterium]